MKLRTIAVVSALSLVTAVAGFAAATALQEGMMAPQTTGQHKWLKQHAGTWDATVQMMGAESKGTWTVRSALGGLWNVSEFQGDMMGMPFGGMEITGYDPTKEAFVSVWVDSMTTSLSLLEGQYDEDQKKLVMKGEGLGMDGQPATMTNVTEYKDADTMVFSMSMPGPDGEDLPMMTIEYKRKK